MQKLFLFYDICNFDQYNTAKRDCWTWYLFVNLPEGVVGLVSFWRGRSVTCQWWILEFGFVLQIFIFRLQIVEFGIVLQIYILSVALPIIFFVEFIFHLQEMGLLDKVHLKLLLWIVCVLRLFIKSENSSIDFYNNCSIFTVSVNCLSVDTFHNIRK